jgi:hypothetical protein
MEGFKGFASVDPSDGRLLVWDGDKFSARKVDGVWEYGKAFSADDLKDNFERVRDEAEAISILNEAKASLSV